MACFLFGELTGSGVQVLGLGGGSHSALPERIGVFIAFEMPKLAKAHTNDTDFADF